MSDRAAARRSDFVGSKALLKRCFALAKLEFINTNLKKSMRFGNMHPASERYFRACVDF